MHISSIRNTHAKSIKLLSSKIAWPFSKTFTELNSRACGLKASWRIKLWTLSKVLKQQVILGMANISEKHAVSIFMAFLQIVFSTYETKRCHNLEYHYNKCSQIKLYNSEDRTCKVAITLSDLWSNTVAMIGTKH